MLNPQHKRPEGQSLLSINKWRLLEIIGSIDLLFKSNNGYSIIFESFDESHAQIVRRISEGILQLQGNLI
jgi:hypothetical protein